MIVARVKRAGLKPMEYHRKKYAGRKTKSNYSVHDPFLDLKRKARTADLKVVQKYPQARDTKRQSSARYVGRHRLPRGRTYRKPMRRLNKRDPLYSLLNP
jgi:hypothetical protein